MTSSEQVDPHLLRVGQVLRDKKGKSPLPIRVDGVTNIYAATYLEGAKPIPFSKGINPMAAVAANGGPRRPAILISSSPHKTGSVVTPWQDLFAPDDGYVRYHGDAKVPGARAIDAEGNRLLVEQFERHHGATTAAAREKAVPLILFERVRHNGIAKGFPKFQGLGIIDQVKLVSQHSDSAGEAFANYEFEIAVLGLAAEGENFDWKWINARRDASLSLAQTTAIAPKSWRTWVKGGDERLESVRRRVLRRKLTPVPDQLPLAGSSEAKVLAGIYQHYGPGMKHRFEALAAAVAERLISPKPGAYRTHGVTRGSGDFGIDFIAQLDIGAGFSRTPLVVLGQAKCVVPGSSTDASDLARTVARLRRGWIGVFVTTGSVSVRAQTEVYEDRYPLVLITGRQVAEVTAALLHESEHDSLTGLLSEFDDMYELAPRVADPERLVV